VSNMFAAFRATDVSEDKALKVAEALNRHDELLSTLHYLIKTPLPCKISLKSWVG
jgi:hypothetical protein